MNTKPRQKSNIASIVELFLMFLLLLVVIVVITMAGMTTREQSLHAHYLTEAVICAENTAEVTATAKDAEEAAELIGKMDGVSDIKVNGDKISASLDEYRIEVLVSADESSSGTYISEDINVFRDDSKAIYSLQTGAYNSNP